MKNFNYITGLNYQLREDRAAVAQRRWRCLQAIEERRERAEERAQRLDAILDMALIGAILAAFAVLVALGV